MNQSVDSWLNIAQRFRDHAVRNPNQVALYFPAASRGRRTIYGRKTYGQLDAESDAVARVLSDMGIRKGMKTIFMVRPGPELFVIALGLFKLGAVPVIVDPGMGVKRMLHCYRSAGAEAMVAVPLGHLVRLLHPHAFASLRVWVSVGKAFGLSVPNLWDATKPSTDPFPLAQTLRDDLVAVNFTTGSTGPAKGVDYTQAMVDATVRILSDEYEGCQTAVTLATLPLFGLFDLLCGCTVVLPPMDPTKPAAAPPEKVLDALRRFSVTHMFASPALLDRLAQYAVPRGETLPSLRHVVSGGAPVSTGIVEQFRRLMVQGSKLHTTYGATEALPIARIEAEEILGETALGTRAGKGTCVGLPCGELRIRLVRPSDGPITTWDPSLEVLPGEVGEVIIAGPNVSSSYHENPRANVLHKIRDGQVVWHRTGDLGWLDAAGRLWFCGRKAHTVHTRQGPLYTAQWEGVFNTHPAVRRSALVGVGPIGAQVPVVCIERIPTKERGDLAVFRQELRGLARSCPTTEEARTFLFHGRFPVDIRHNAKIDREALGHWATAMRERADGRAIRQKWLLRLIPILGWVFLVWGLLAVPSHPVVRALWWVDVFLSVGLHALQLVVALPTGRRAGYSTLETVVFTMLFGATWWKMVEPMDAVRAFREEPS